MATEANSSEATAAKTVAEAEVPELDSIAKLAAMDDTTLAATMGLSAKLEDAKKQIAEMNKLTGKGREYAETRVKEMLTPHIYDLSYTVEEAKRRNKPKTARAEMANTSCDCFD